MTGPDDVPQRHDVDGDNGAPVGPAARDGRDGEADGEGARQAHERRRRRAPRRVLLIGVPTSLLLALVTGLFGMPGAVAGAAFISLLSLTAGIAGATVAVGVVVDQFRGHTVPASRVLLTGGLLLLTLVLLVASAGATLAAARGGL